MGNSIAYQPVEQTARDTLPVSDPRTARVRFTCRGAGGIRQRLAVGSMAYAALWCAAVWGAVWGVTTPPSCARGTEPRGSSLVKRLERRASQMDVAADVALMFQLELTSAADLPDEQRQALVARLAHWKQVAHEGRVRLGNQWVAPEARQQAAAAAMVCQLQAAELFKVNNVELARDKLREASQVYPNGVLAEFTLGLTYISVENDPQRARQHFAECQRRDPNHVAALNNLAVCELRLGHPLHAIAFLCDAMVLGPRTPQVLHNAGHFLELVAREQIVLKKSSLKKLSEMYSLLVSTHMAPAAQSGTGWLYMQPTVEPVLPDPNPDHPPAVAPEPGALERVRCVADGSASAFCIAPNLFLTNHHVIADAEIVEITDPQNPQGAPLAARVAAQDAKADLALVKCPALIVPPLRLAGTLPRRAAEVLALGYPLSDLLGAGLKATRGIVTGTPVADTADLLLIDATINPGNSGGPLLDTSGHVVGIVSAKLRASGAAAVDSYGLAIPSLVVLEFLHKVPLEVAVAMDGNRRTWEQVDAEAQASVVRINILRKVVQTAVQPPQPLPETSSPVTFLEDQTCPFCGGYKQVDCPARDCARGRVGVEQTRVFGRSHLGIPITGSFKGRVSCASCGGDGVVACPYCHGTGNDPALR